MALVNIVSEQIAQGGGQLSFDTNGNLVGTDGIRIGSGSKHGYFSILASRSTIDWHAFEDWVQLNTTDTGLGYASFDAKPTMTNSLAQGHFVGYQARQIYNGSANLTSYMHGYDTDMQHTGTGTIQLAAGVYLKDVGGTGPITYDYGIYIENIARATNVNNNYAIYAVGGKNYFGGQITCPLILTGVQNFGLNYGVDVAGKIINIGFGTAGQTQFGTIDIYNGKNGKVASITSAGLSLVSSSLFLGSFTVATLPTASEGAVAYCTNGRKTGEGAGVGTGVPVYYSAGAWKVFSTDATVAA
jgi:hypothetical protein